MYKLNSRTLFLLAALVFLVGACSPDEPTPTALAVLTTVEVTRPTATDTAVPRTPTMIAAATETAVPTTPTRTPVPTRTPRPTHTPTITPVPLPVWAPDIAVLIEVEDRDVVWSPTANEFLTSKCHPETDGEGPSITLERITAPDFVPYLLVEFDSFCNLFLDKMWSPDGEKIVYAGPLSDVENDFGDAGFSEVWKTDRNGLNIHLGGVAQWLGFLGWLNEETVAFSGYAGGGHSEATLLDINTDEILASGIIHGSFYHPSNSYLPGYDGNDLWGWVSAVVLSTEINENGYKYLSGPNIHYLSNDQEIHQYIFNSHFEDWLPGTNQMLVLTWEGSISLWGDALFKYGPEAQLQLWDVDSGSLSPLIASGVHGRFSPDGRTLSFLSVGPPETDSTDQGSMTNDEGYPFFFRQLFDKNESVITLSLPSSAEADLNGSAIRNHDAFSPDSQLFAFFTPGSVLVDGNGHPTGVEHTVVEGNTQGFLNIYDISSGQILHSFLAAKMQPVWSPNSDKLVFRSLQGDLTVMNVANGRLTPLTINGGSRLSEPQWSYDGRYLSVRINLDGIWHSAVIITPD